MLYFYCASSSELETIRRSGISAKNSPVRLWQSLDDVRVNCTSDRILVIDGFALHQHALLQHHNNGHQTATASQVPVATIQNLAPYIPPVSVTAGGGYVLQGPPEAPEVLTIFRRGVWDLPKGKVESGETPQEGALREVREEVGINNLSILSSLRTTLHGYLRSGQYHVKTTFWYAMQTPESSFTPEKEEQIERVEWMPWSQAKKQLGYQTLRQHMVEVEPLIADLLQQQ